MKNENQFLSVTPRIVPADGWTTITVEGLFGHTRFQDENEYEISCFPMERFSEIGEYKYQGRQKIKPVHGQLQIRQYFKGEQEHILEIWNGAEGNPDKPLQIRIYSLCEDLFGRKPYKGDLHMHSSRSDGKESPEFVAAACRKIGLDFMAVTDHRRYGPSIEAQAAFAMVETDLQIFRGEEIHAENNPVHIINFGGAASINEAMIQNRESYQEEVAEIMKGLTDMADEDARYQCASSTWIFDKIRKEGGMGIFCHPYWLIREGYHISNTVTSYMLDKQPYDAYEVIGGYFKHEADSNTLQVARYHEERSKGRKIPIVGVSDAHGCENSDLFGWYYTLVFAPSPEQQDLIGSIRDLYSVAVEALPGEIARAYGPFRLVKYALFLLREILPGHDELCHEEGQWMVRHLSGEEQAASKLKELKGRTVSLYERLWAKEV